MSDSPSVLMNMGAEVATAAGARPMAGQPAVTGNSDEFANILQSVLPAGPSRRLNDPLLTGQIEIDPLLFSQLDGSANQLLTPEEIDLAALFGGKELPVDEPEIAWQAMLSEYDSTDPDTPRLVIAAGDEEAFQIEDVSPYDMFTGKMPQGAEKLPADNLSSLNQASRSTDETEDDIDNAAELPAPELAAALALANRQDIATSTSPVVTTAEDENVLKLAGLQKPSNQHSLESIVSKSDRQTESDQFSLDKLSQHADATGTETNNAKTDISTFHGLDGSQGKTTGASNNSAMSNQGASTYAAVSGMGALGASSQTNTAPVIAGLTVPPQNPAWGEVVGDRIQWMASQNIQEARIRLNPPELGLLEVRVQIGHDQQTTISFSSPHSQVRDALETAVPRLREMFGDSGLTLGDVNVSHQSMSEQRHAGHGNQSANPAANKFSNASTETTDPILQARPLIQGTGMLDLYA